MSLVLASAIASTTAAAVSSSFESEKKAVNVKLRAEAQLVKERKLLLLLDIDLTILQSILRTKYYKGPQTLIATRNNTQWRVLLRPHLHSFLQTISPLYRIVLHTKSGGDYAAEVRKLIDPQNKWISGLIHATSFSVRQKEIKSIQDATFCDPRFVVILDDFPEVWPASQPNLIIASPFTPLSSHPGEWVHGDTLFMQDRSLLRFQSLLMTLHVAFYLDPTTSDTRQLLPLMCGGILSAYILVVGWTEVTDLHLEYMLLKASVFGAQLLRAPPEVVPDKTVCYVVCQDSTKRSASNQVCIRWLEHCVHNMVAVSAADFYKTV